MPPDRLLQVVNPLAIPPRLLNWLRGFRVQGKCIALFKTCKEMYTHEQITELLEGLNDAELLNLWNEYQSEISGESQVYEFDDEFFEVYFSDPQECGRAVFFGKINSWADKYIMFNGYGNLESSSYLSEMISIYDLASHIEGKQDEYSDLLIDIETEDED